MQQCSSHTLLEDILPEPTHWTEVLGRILLGDILPGCTLLEAILVVKVLLRGTLERTPLAGKSVVLELGIKTMANSEGYRTGTVPAVECLQSYMTVYLSIWLLPKCPQQC